VIEDEQNRKMIHTALGKGYNVKVEQLMPHTVCLQLREEYKTSKNFKVNLRDFRSSTRGTMTTLQDCTDADVGGGQTPTRNFEFNRDEFDKADNYIFSLMGVLGDAKTELGKKVVRKINSLIEHQKRVIIITNNSNKTRVGLMEELENKEILLRSTTLARSLSQRMGTEEAKRAITNKHIVTSANTCAWFLKQKGIKKPFVICSTRAILEELEYFDIKNYVATVDEKGKPKQEYLEELTEARVRALIEKAPDVDAVVVAWDQVFSALKVAVASQYLKWSQEKGTPMPVISCSMDPSGILGTTPADFCTQQGFNNRKIRAVGNGAMTGMITNCIEFDDVIDVGKPSTILLEQLKRPADEEEGLGLDFSKTVMIGSTLNTDIALANGGGMKSLLVLSGVTQKEDVEKEDHPLRIPTWIIENFAEI
jgi:phosphoglycolate phosphatase